MSNNKYVVAAVLSIVKEAHLAKEGFASFVTEQIRVAVENSIDEDSKRRHVNGLTKPTVRLPDLLAVESFCRQANSFFSPGYGKWSAE
jgi:hypothetical protein